MNQVVIFACNPDTNRMKFRLTFALTAILSVSEPVLCQTNPLSNVHDSKLFGSTEMINVKLSFDVTEVKKNRDSKEYTEGKLSWIEGNDSITRQIKLRSRGIFRRKYCDLPPIMLNFKPDSSGNLFSYLDKLKLVPECPPGNQENLLREYLIYRMYNVLTENSFRVRLLRVNYVNTSRKERSFTEYAFVIEPVELLAKRIESVEVKTTNLNQKSVKPEMMDRVALFNYMIGNTDWSVPIAHNVVLFAQYRSERPDLAVIVPYDFDFAGLVNTQYAAPFFTLNIESVRERLYLGICRSKEVYLNALKEFINPKEQFYKVILDFPYLDKNSKDDMIYYLDTFYEELEEPENLARTLMKQCIRF